MKRILPFWLLLSLSTSSQLFASFELGVIPGIWLEYVQPSTFAYEMNTPGTPSYVGTGTIPLGAFNESIFGGDILKSQMSFFAEGKLDLRFAWLGDGDPRNTVVVDLRLRGFFKGGRRALFPEAELYSLPLYGDLGLDLYYQGFFGGMNGYIKFGKYLADTPSNWGGQINAPTLEFGYDNPQYLKFFFNVGLYHWGHVEKAWYNNQGGHISSTSWSGDPFDIDAPYREPFGNGKFGDYVAANTIFSPFGLEGFQKASFVSTFGLDIPIAELGEFNLRIPFETGLMKIARATNNFRLSPISQVYLDNGFFFSNTLFGLMIRKAELETETGFGYVFVGQEEVGFRYADYFQTNIMFSFQTAGENYNTYSFTKLNARNPLLIHHGPYIPYLYEEVVPHTGQYSFSVSQHFTWHNFLFKLGLGTFWAIRPENLPFSFYTREGSHIGLSYFAGIDWLGITGAGSAFKLEASLFQPTQLSKLSGGSGSGTLLSNKLALQSRKFYFAIKVMLEHTFR